MPLDMERLLDSVRMVESGGDRLARSPKGALGPYQFMPDTAKQYGVADPFDEQQARNGARKYLTNLLGMFNGDMNTALAAWNWGEGHVQRNGLAKAPRETVNFVQRVNNHYGNAPAPTNDTPTVSNPRKFSGGPEDLFVTETSPVKTPSEPLFDVGGESEQLAASVRKGSDIPENTAIRTFKMQLATGLPAGLVADNLDELEGIVSKEGFNADEFRKNSPLLARWVSQNPNFAALAKNDTANLTAMETAWATVEAIPKGFKQGLAENELMGLNYKAVTGTITPEENKRRGELKKWLQENSVTTKGLPSWTGAFSDFLGSNAPSTFQSLREGLMFGAPAGAAVGAIAGIEAGPPGMAAGATAGALTGFKVASTASFIKNIYETDVGDAYSDLENAKDAQGNPIDPMVARYAALVVGAPNAFLETLALSRVVKAVPGGEKLIGSLTGTAVKSLLTRPTVMAALKSAAFKHADSIASETFTEGFQQFLVILAREIATGDLGAGVTKEDASSIAQAATQAFKATAMGAGLSIGPKAVEIYHDVSVAQRNETFMRTLGEATSNSSLAKKLPEAVRNFVENLKQDGNVKDVFVPVEKWDALFQDRAQEVAQEVLGNPNAYLEAKAIGGDLVIPIENYVEKLAGTNFHQSLIMDSRLHPGELTPNEAKVAQQLTSDIVALHQEKLAEIENASYQKVYDDVHAKLVAAGMDTVVADRNALLERERYRTRAERLGVDAWTLYSEKPLTIQKEFPVAGAQPTLFQQNLPLEEGVVSPAEESTIRQTVAEVVNTHNGLVDAGSDTIGSTVQPGRGSVVGKPAVAVGFMPERALWVDGKKLDPAFLDEFVRRNWDLLGKFPDLSVGTWYSAQDNKTYVDITATPKDASTAINIATNRGWYPSSFSYSNNWYESYGAQRQFAETPGPEKAVFDLQNFEEIPVPQTAEETRQEGFKHKLSQQPEVKSLPAVEDVIRLLPEQMELPGLPSSERKSVVTEQGNKVSFSEGGNYPASIVIRKEKSGKTYLTLAGRLKVERRKHALERAVMGLHGWMLEHDTEVTVDPYKAKLDPTAVSLFNVLDNDYFKITPLAGDSFVLSAIPHRTEVANAPLATLPFGMPIELAKGSDVAFDVYIPKFEASLEINTSLNMAFTELSHEAKQTMIGLFETLIKNGFPESVINIPKRFMAAYYGDSGAQASYYVPNQTLAISAPTLEALRSGKLDDAQKREVVMTLFHELGHAASIYLGDKGEISPIYVSPLFAFHPMDVEIKLTDTFQLESFSLKENARIGAVARELFNTWSDKTMPQDLRNFLNYPLFQAAELISNAQFAPVNASYEDYHNVQAEMYAQLNAIFYAYPEWMQENMPQSYNVMREIDAYLKTDTVLAPDIADKVASALQLHQYKETRFNLLNTTLSQYQDALFQSRVEKATEQGYTVKAYHGTKGNFSQFYDWTNVEEDSRYVLPDILLGSHFAKTPVISNRFATGFSKKLSEAIDGSVYPVLLRGPFKVIPQTDVSDASTPIYEGDTSSVARDIWKTTLPSHHDIFLAWIQYTRRVSPEEAVHIMNLLEKGIAPDTPDIRMDARSSDTSLGDYVANFDPIGALFSSEQKLELINSYREQLEKEGYHGVQYINTSSAETRFAKTPDDYISYITWGNNIRSVNAQFEEPTSANILAQEKRGAYFPSSNTIALLRNADPSTFVHELGHSWLEELRSDALRADAPEQLRADWETVRTWIGATNEIIPVESHEKFARGVEQYFMLGKAPSMALQNAFTQFKNWLVRIYKQLAALDVELTPQVSDVMDRMLASDEAIAQAREYYGYQTPLLERGVMTEAEYEAYRKLNEAAKQEAENAIRVKVMKDLTNERVAAWRDKKASLRAEVEQHLNDVPIYRALFWLQNGLISSGMEIPGLEHVRLDKNAILSMGYDPKALPWRTTQVENGVHPDAAAELLGFNSGEELLKGLAGLPSRKAAIDEMVTARMKEEFDYLSTESELHEAAALEIQNVHQVDLLELELRILKRLGAKREVSHAAVLKNLAATMLANRTIDSIKPRLYEEAAIKAGIDAEKAMLGREMRMGTARNLDAAFDAKQRQMLNLFLYKQAVEIQTETGKTIKNWERLLFRPDTRLAKTRNMDLVNTARSIAAQHGIGKAEDTPGAYMEALRVYDPQTYADMLDIVQLATSDNRSYKDMTVDEFSIMKDSINGLWTLSRRSKQIEINGVRLDRDIVINKMAMRINELVGTSAKRTGYSQAVGNWDKLKMGLMGVRASLRRVESWVSAIDGPNAEFRKFLWEPISNAADQFRIARVKALTSFLELTRPIEKTLVPGKIEAYELNYTFANKAELLGALLHTGNESNLQKLLRGREWGAFTPEGVIDTSKWDAFIKRLWQENKLTKADYEFVQSVWDLLDSFKPLAQKAHREMYGYYFSEVTAQPVRTPWGEFKGGYYPAIVDPYVSEDAALRADKEAMDSQASSFMFPTTGRGFTKSRVQQYARPLILDLGLATQHIQKVLRFIYLEPHVKDVGRVVTNRNFRDVLGMLDSEVGSNMLVPWLQRTARQSIDTPSTSRTGRWVDSFFRTVRSRTGMQLMVANVTNAMQQFTGLSIAAVKVPPRYLAGALWRYVRNPSGLSQAINDLSPFMQTRVGAQAVEIQNTIDDIVLNPSKFEKAREFATKHGYMLQAGTQQVVDLITWSGAYEQALETGLDQSEAVKKADSAVRETQGSFAPEDVSRFETLSPAWRVFTQFYNYFNMQANLLGTEFVKSVRQGGFGGAGRALYVYTMGMLIPAFISELLTQMMSGDAYKDDDDDGYLDNILSMFFSSQFRTATAMVPVVGPVLQSAVNQFNNKWYDDRISTSPAISMLESVSRAPYDAYKLIADDNVRLKRPIQDILTTVGMLTGLPLAPLSRPIGYLTDTAQGYNEPSGALDMARGLISGKTSK